MRGARDSASLSTSQPGWAWGEPRLGHWGLPSCEEASPFRTDRWVSRPTRILVCLDCSSLRRTCPVVPAGMRAAGTRQCWCSRVWEGDCGRGTRYAGPISSKSLAGRMATAVGQFKTNKQTKSSKAPPRLPEPLVPTTQIGVGPDRSEIGTRATNKRLL